MYMHQASAYPTARGLEASDDLVLLQVDGEVASSPLPCHVLAQKTLEAFHCVSSKRKTNRGFAQLEAAIVSDKDMVGALGSEARCQAVADGAGQAQLDAIAKGTIMVADGVSRYVATALIQRVQRHQVGCCIIKGSVYKRWESVPQLANCARLTGHNRQHGGQNHIELEHGCCSYRLAVGK